MPEIVTRPISPQEMGNIQNPSEIVQDVGMFVRHPEKPIVSIGLEEARVHTWRLKWKRWDILEQIRQGIKVNPNLTPEQALEKALQGYTNITQEHEAFRAAHEEFDNPENLGNPNVITHFNRQEYVPLLIRGIKWGIHNRNRETREKHSNLDAAALGGLLLPELVWQENLNHIRMRPHQRLYPISLLGVASIDPKARPPVDLTHPEKSQGTYHGGSVLPGTGSSGHEAPPPDDRPPEERHLPHLHGKRMPDAWKAKKRPWWRP
jgi:hypothetical protein